jgi:hypothetical protein
VILAVELADILVMAVLIAMVFLLLALPEIIYQRFDRRRHPEREARQLKYKPIWKILSVLVWNGGVIGALILRGDLAAALTAILLVAGYIVFRYFLMRSPAMKRRFLAVPPPGDAPAETARSI